MQGLVPASVATVAIDFSYLLVAFLFIMGLKAMSSPVTARRGIVVAGVGMLIGTLMSFLYPGMGNFPLMLAAIALSWPYVNRTGPHTSASRSGVRRACWSSK